MLSDLYTIGFLVTIMNVMQLQDMVMRTADQMSKFFLYLGSWHASFTPVSDAFHAKSSFLLSLSNY